MADFLQTTDTSNIPGAPATYTGTQVADRFEWSFDYGSGSEVVMRLTGDKKVHLYGDLVFHTGITRSMDTVVLNATDGNADVASFRTGSEPGTEVLRISSTGAIAAAEFYKSGQTVISDGNLNFEVQDGSGVSTAWGTMKLEGAVSVLDFTGAMKLSAGGDISVEANGAAWGTIKIESTTPVLDFTADMKLNAGGDILLGAGGAAWGVIKIDASIPTLDFTGAMKLSAGGDISVEANGAAWGTIKRDGATPVLDFTGAMKLSAGGDIGVEANGAAWGTIKIDTSIPTLDFTGAMKLSAGGDITLSADGALWGVVKIDSSVPTLDFTTSMKVLANNTITLKSTTGTVNFETGSTGESAIFDSNSDLLIKSGTAASDTASLTLDSGPSGANGTDWKLESNSSATYAQTLIFYQNSNRVFEFTKDAELKVLGTSTKDAVLELNSTASGVNGKEWSIVSVKDGSTSATAGTLSIQDANSNSMFEFSIDSEFMVHGRALKAAIIELDSDNLTNGNIWSIESDSTGDLTFSTNGNEVVMESAGNLVIDGNLATAVAAAAPVNTSSLPIGAFWIDTSNNRLWIRKTDTETGTSDDWWYANLTKG